MAITTASESANSKRILRRRSGAVIVSSFRGPTERSYACSNSKLFTAIAVLQLRDAGKLRLDDPLSEHLEWFNIEDLRPGDEAITIRRILTHSSGLPRAHFN